uniref:Caspase activity and apoptosis inhibitor 1 n=1 Tax=Neolamprologus brichardi TaxID=32507 RepID=A0A3Q4H9I1_NEOBR
KMLKKKSSTSEKKRKHFQSEERHDMQLRALVCLPHLKDSKDELADPELDKIGSDIEEGGLDLSLAFKPITAYVGDKREMLEQCFHVLGEKKLRKMLPDELKVICLKRLSLSVILKQLISEQLHCDCVFISHVYFFPPPRQDSIVDSTSCLKETAKSEDPKQEAGGSGEESDVLSINADTYDSDIEGPKEELCTDPAANPEPANPEPKKDIQSDIDKSVSEILATPLQSPDVSGPVSSGDPAVCKPSIQQLELLELEMRARAIKALMKASNGKTPHVTANT